MSTCMSLTKSCTAKLNWELKLNAQLSCVIRFGIVEIEIEYNANYYDLLWDSILCEVSVTREVARSTSDFQCWRYESCIWVIMVMRLGQYHMIVINVASCKVGQYRGQSATNMIVFSQGLHYCLSCERLSDNCG